VLSSRYIVNNRYDHSWGGYKFFVVDMQTKDYATDQMWLTEKAAQHEADQLNKENHGISL
jgi:hypothetical protein